MSWDVETVVLAGRTVGFGGTLWILHLAGNTDVGVGKTSDYHTQRGSVKAYAKSIGLDEPTDPQLKAGYSNISRKQVVDSDGNRGRINNEHKPDILSLTTFGKTLMTAVHRDDRIERALRESIGADVDRLPDPWWIEGEPDPDHAIFLRTRSDRVELDKELGEIEVIATFDCPRCAASIEHRYFLILHSGDPPFGWSQYAHATCERCDQEYKHLKADRYNQPQVVQ